MNNAWNARPPQLSDVNSLLAIATAVSQSTTPIQAIMQQGNGRFWTLTHQSQPIGYAALLPLPGLPHLFELAGGIAPAFQRQGAGSFLWRAVQEAVAGTAVRQITFTTDDLTSPTTRFLQRHHFEVEHEEWTMQLENVATAVFTPPNLPAKLQKGGRETAVRTLLIQQATNSVRGLSAYAQPMQSAIFLNGKFSGIGQRIVMTNSLNDTAVSLGIYICYNHAVARLSFLASTA